MAYLLFPGRHHLLTNFQLECLTLATAGGGAGLLDVDGRPLALDEPVSLLDRSQQARPLDTVIWAITSANHSNTRRNPLAAHRREAAIEHLACLLDVPSYVYLVDDVGHSPRFAEYVLKKIEVDSRGRHCLTPHNTVLGCSTPEVIEMYERLGFRVLPFELADRRLRTFHALTPWEVLESVVQSVREGRDWRTDATFLTKAARASRQLYLKYDFGDLLADLYRQPFLTDDGDLTATRDYNTYVRTFDEGARRKYELIDEHIVPGRIVDVGCCTGSLIRELALDDRLRESDFYGIEAARTLYAECLHRKEQGAFANDNVFFYQCDFAAGPLFAANSVNTFITCSLTHEVESYLGRPALERFIMLLHGQLALGGRWLNVDVVGPEDGDDTVLLWLCSQDGRNEGWQINSLAGSRDSLCEQLAGLSTWALFLRFAADFRRGEGYSLPFEAVDRDGQHYARLRLADACEFMTKKDYLDNWQSEMHETFRYWSFAQWREAVERAGFRVHAASRAFANPWIVENRYRGKVQLFREIMSSGAVPGEPGRTVLQPLDYPVTTMLLVAEKAE